MIAATTAALHITAGAAQDRNPAMACAATQAPASKAATTAAHVLSVVAGRRSPGVAGDVSGLSVKASSIPSRTSTSHVHVVGKFDAVVAEQAGLSLAHLVQAFAVAHPAVTSATRSARSPFERSARKRSTNC